MVMLRRSKRLKEKSDRLSDLPNAILLHIMSFMMIQDAIKTCILSKRWKNLWKFLPDLTLHSSKFRNPLQFCEFVSGIVRCRGGYHSLRTLDFERLAYFCPQVLNDLLQYARFHNLQNLKISVLTI